MEGNSAIVHNGEINKEEERRVRRKVDCIILPVLMITLGLQYYDKAVLGSAAVFGILEDLVSSLTSPSLRHLCILKGSRSC